MGGEGCCCRGSAARAEGLKRVAETSSLLMASIDAKLASSAGGGGGTTAAGDEDGGGEGNLAGPAREEGENWRLRADDAGEARATGALGRRWEAAESRRVDDEGDEASRDEGEWCGGAATLVVADDDEVDRCRARPGDCW